MNSLQVAKYLRYNHLSKYWFGLPHERSSFSDKDRKGNREHTCIYSHVQKPLRNRTNGKQMVEMERDKG